MKGDERYKSIPSVELVKEKYQPIQEIPWVLSAPSAMMRPQRLHRRAAEPPDARFQLILEKLFDKIPELPSTQLKKGNAPVLKDVLTLAKKELPKGNLLGGRQASTDGTVFTNRQTPELGGLTALPERAEYREFRLFNPDLNPKNIQAGFTADQLNEFSKNYRLLVSADGDILVTPNHYFDYFQLDRVNNKWVSHKTGLVEVNGKLSLAPPAEASKPAFQQLLDNMNNIANENIRANPDLVRLPFGKDVALGVTKTNLPADALTDADLQRVIDLPEKQGFNAINSDAAKNFFQGDSRSFDRFPLSNKNNLIITNRNELVLAIPVPSPKEPTFHVYNRQTKRWSDGTKFVTEDLFNGASLCGAAPLPARLMRRQGTLCGRKVTPPADAGPLFDDATDGARPPNDPNDPANKNKGTDAPANKGTDAPANQ
ncbi:hypothetical protein HK102_000798, partial [Quaeritorhiza haematococci]